MTVTLAAAARSSAATRPSRSINRGAPGAAVKGPPWLSTPDTLAPGMAGPAIRAWRLAAELAKTHDAIDVLYFGT